MEIGEEGVGDFEVEGWMDENARSTGAWLPCVSGGALKDTQGGGANANYFSAVLLYSRDFFKANLRNKIAFFMHAVVFYLICLYGSESSSAHMECHKSMIDAA